MYLRHDGRAVPIAVRGGIPSAERRLGDRETAKVDGWNDTDADRAWLAADPSRVLRAIDRFHPVPDVPARARVVGGVAVLQRHRQRLPLLPDVHDGTGDRAGPRSVGVRLQLERGGALDGLLDARATAERARDRRAPRRISRSAAIASGWRAPTTDVTLDLPAETRQRPRDRHDRRPRQSGSLGAAVRAAGRRRLGLGLHRPGDGRHDGRRTARRTARGSTSPTAASITITTGASGTACRGSGARCSTTACRSSTAGCRPPADAADPGARARDSSPCSARTGRSPFRPTRRSKRRTSPGEDRPSRIVVRAAGDDFDRDADARMSSRRR